MALQRSNVMLEDDVKNMLKNLSEETGKSMSQLVNEAARQTFMSYVEQTKRIKSLEEFLQFREQFRGKVKAHEIKEFINEGRK